MAQYDVFKAPAGDGLWLDVQTDFLTGINTRVVAPLQPIDVGYAPTGRLNPVFAIDDSKYLLEPQMLAAVPQTILKSPIANLSDHFAEITSALDMVFQGF